MSFSGGVSLVAILAISGLPMTAGFSGSKPTFTMDIDNAKVLSPTGSISYPPMVSVPCAITEESEACLTELIKPPNVDDLYDWYVSTQNQPNADPSWAVVWPTAISLANHLLENPELVKNKKVLELGAGLSVCGLTAAALGAKSVTLTDREPFALHCALASASCNQLSQVKGSILDWCESEEVEKVDVILASDVLYDGETVEALATACKRLVAPGGIVLLSDPRTERFSGARKTLQDSLAAATSSIEVFDLPLPGGEMYGGSSLDARDHSQRMKEPTVLVSCTF